ncbi:MAG: SAM hydrolase/SAM-dependent halogenase family protein [Candidatus Cyclobacteriaceae bacterium M2_1C_046]
MAIITLLTDFGEEDHYVAAVKGKILSFIPSAQLVDISHQNPLSDISAAAFTVNAAFKNFPAGTIHVIAIQQQLHNQEERMIAARLGEHYFILPDNGLLSLISDKEPDMVVDLPVESENTSFICREVLAPAAAKLAAGGNLTDLGKPAGEVKRLMNRVMRATMKQISGHVIKTDHYGNLITNIEEEAFKTISKKAGEYTLIFGRERINRVHRSYNSVEAGELFIIFNSQGLLEIGINQGNAEQLLGLTLDSPVIINFQES